jgi:hypothetical protein
MQERTNGPYANALAVESHSAGPCWSTLACYGRAETCSGPGWARVVEKPFPG